MRLCPRSLALASRGSVLGLGLESFLCPWPWPRALCPQLHLWSSPEVEHFFSRNSSTDLHSDAHQSQIIRGDADENHTQIVGGYTVKLLGGYIPHPPWVSAPLLPRTDPLEAKDRNARGEDQGPRTQAQVFSKKKVFKQFFQAISIKKRKKKVFKTIFRAFSRKNAF